MTHPFDGPPLTTLGFDCDDTLWHNENIFQSTHERFASVVLRYMPGADAAHIDARLLETERKNLALFGYGIKGFTLSMIETAIELTEGRIQAQDLHDIIDFGKQMLAHPVEVFHHITDILHELSHQGYRLLALTKGDLFDQESKVARSGLGDFFDHVEVMSEKDPATYSAVFSRLNVDPKQFLMVGNSVKSDILPVLELGARAVHIPYAITWEHEQVDITDGLPPGAWTLTSMAGLPQLLSQFPQRDYQSLNS